jgi:epoxyqueuosine reductase
MKSFNVIGIMLYERPYRIRIKRRLLLEKLSHILKEIAMIEGACVAGIATTETLEGGPPSTDLTYVLPHAKSTITFAVPIDRKVIAPYLMKKDRLPLERDFIRANALASGIAVHLANYLRQKGYPAVPVAANLVYRPEVPGGASSYVPDISHRYLAVRSGVGHLGLSGNILTKDHGGSVILSSTVTTVPLIPTDPLPAEDNYCDECRLCMAACISGFMDRDVKTTITLGGIDFNYSRRRHVSRCDCVCSGYTGLHPSGIWSTWSPGRFIIPEDDDRIAPAQERMVRAYRKWPLAPGGRYFFYTDDKLRVACGHCQFVCCSDKEERKARYKMLTGSGVVVQHPDGSLEAFSPAEAKARLAALPAYKRALYEEA